MVRAALETYISNGCDFLIALGGGSPQNTMKDILEEDIIEIYKRVWVKE